METRKKYNRLEPSLTWKRKDNEKWVRKEKVKQKEHGGREEIFDIISSYQRWSLDIVLHYCTATETQRNDDLKNKSTTPNHSFHIF